MPEMVSTVSRNLAAVGYDAAASCSVCGFQERRPLSVCERSTGRARRANGRQRKRSLLLAWQVF